MDDASDKPDHTNDDSESPKVKEVLAGGLIGRAKDSPNREQSPVQMSKLFEFASTRVVMERLFDGDPIGLQAATVRAIEDRSLLVDPQRFFNILIARAAFCGLLYGVSDDVEIEAWVEQRVEETCSQFMEEDWADERSGQPVDPSDYRFNNLLVGTVFDPARARQLALQFNRMSLDVRRPLYQLLVHRQPIDQVASRFDLTADSLRALVVDRLGKFVKGPRLVSDLDLEWLLSPGKSEENQGDAHEPH